MMVTNKLMFYFAFSHPSHDAVNNYKERKYMNIVLCTSFMAEAVLVH